MTEDRGQMKNVRASKGVQKFEDLEVFRKAYRISLEIHEASESFPKLEQVNGLADQMRRASKGICANIAEGFGKQSVSTAEFKRFLLMAMGSADEMRVWSRYCMDLKYINNQQWQRWKNEYQHIAKMLNGLHKSWQ